MDEKGRVGEDVAAITDTRVRYGTGGRRRAGVPLGRLISRPAAATWVSMVPAVVTLVLGGAFLGRASMWTSEAATWFYSIQPVSHIVRNSAYVDVVYLPYYLFMHFWLEVSQSVWWMRLPSLLAGAATVAALVLLARRWLPLGWSVLAGFLLALNPLFAEWTIQGRQYTAAALFAVLSTAALVHAIDRGGKRRWVLYGLASLTMLLLHLMAVFVLAAHLVGVAIARRRSAVAGLVATLGCVAVAVSPLAVKAAGENEQISWIPKSSLSTFHTALTDVSGGRTTQELALVFCGIIVIAGLASAQAGSDRALGLALGLAWGTVPVFLLVFIGFLYPLYVDRYAVVCLPGIALIEASAGWRVSTILSAQRTTRDTSGPAKRAPTANASFHRQNRQRLALLTAAVIIGAACVAGLGLLTRTSQALQHRYLADEYRSAAAALSSDLSEHPAPVVAIPTWAGIGFSYYATPVALAHALSSQALRASNQHMLNYWLNPEAGSPLRYSTVVAWPIGARPEGATAQCAAGWAIGAGTTPPRTFILDGSSCRVYRVHRYGTEWVASLAR